MSLFLRGVSPSVSRPSRWLSRVQYAVDSTCKPRAWRSALGFGVALCCLLGSLYVLAGAAHADDFTWTGTASNDWNTAGNWTTTGTSGRGFPNDATDTATFPGAVPTNKAPNLSASVTVNALTFNGTGYTVSVTSPATLTLGGTTPTLTVATGSSTISAPIVGSAGMTKAGTGTVVLTSTANAYTGANFLNVGQVTLGSGTTTSSLGATTNATTLQGGAILASGMASSTSITIGQPITVPNGQTGTIKFSDRTVLSGALTGSGTLNTLHQGAISRNDISGNWSAFSGILNMSGTGTVRLLINGGSFGLGLPSATVSVDGVFLAPQTNSTGNAVPIGALTSTGTTGVLGGGSAGSPNYTIGALGANTTFAGTISGNASVTKTGTGTLTLTGANAYSGTTTISAGTLKTGSSTALGTFSGSTTIASTTTVAAAGALDLNGQTVTEPIILAGGTLSNTGASAGVSSGLASFGFSNGGTGITPPATISITGGGGSGAAATASLGVTAASFTISGGTTVYSVAPTVTISGGGGTGATATATLTSGVVSGITITGAGNGFTSAPTIAFSGGTVTTVGTNPTGTGNASNFTLAGVTLTNAGSGYTFAPTVALSSGTGVVFTTVLSSLVMTASSTVTGTGALNIAGPFTNSGGSFTLTNSNTALTTLSGVVNISESNTARTLTISGVGNTLISATISNGGTGAGTLTKSGTGILTLTGVATGIAGLQTKAGTTVIDTGGSVATTGFSSVGVAAGDNGTLTVKGTGNFTCGNDLNIGDSGSIASPAVGTLNIQDSATVSAVRLYVGSNFFGDGAATGTVNQTGGTLTTTSTAAGTFLLGGRNTTATNPNPAGGTGTYNLSGGTVTTNGDAYIGNYGSGALNLSGTGQFSTGTHILSIKTQTTGTGLVSLGGGTLTASSITDAGTLALTVSNIIADSTNLSLNGGSFTTGGNSETLNTLSVPSNSTLDQGQGSSVVKFSAANSTLVGTLSILNYSGTPSGGGTDQFSIGNSQSLTADQLAQIKFINPGTSTGTFASTQLSTGEVVPVLSTPATSGALISEFRFSGPQGALDEFIELANITGSSIDVSGWKVTAGSVTVAIPSGNIPAYGHLLLANVGTGAGTGYSLGTYASATDVTYTDDIDPASSVVLKNAGDIVVDSVGSFAIAPSSPGNQYSYVRRLESGLPQDSGTDTSDFNLVDITSTSSTVDGTGVGLLTAARLGAPGPQNTLSPIQRNVGIAISSINIPGNGLAGTAVTPEARYVSKNSTIDPKGRLSLRRAIKNNTLTTVTQMRFRIVAITAGTSTTGGVADVRPISSGGVRYYASDGSTIMQAAWPLVLEKPSLPNEAPLTATSGSTGKGGGLNSSWTVAIPGGLAPGASVGVEFLFGIVTDGQYRIVVDTELLN
ncbi:hypothetical protein IAD21_04426 [Abditibacteriota bacterium]|nr:hypothetical protein IAD21_04426 [Abditibacteriota bacterium]